MEDGVKGFFQKYGGAIIGGIIALVLACTNLYRIVIGIVLVVIGMWAGNYFQKNKDAVKEKLKNLIDKM
ncbi:MAG: DUF2273 domain-containing protein [Clostridia bacterium]|nr:DUF2273 domain-containing protein [Clostridia bacterium]